jgi:site-specific DNA recombinase
MDTEKIRYFVYCRKSSEDKHKQILSLPAQKRVLVSYSKKNRLQIVDIYEESKSAHTIGRPAFNEMLNRINKGEAQGIVVWDESRIARNSLDGAQVIYMLDEGQILEIHKPGRIYTNTPDDKSWLAMCFMMSKKESDDKGVNVKRGLSEKAEKGWLPSSWTKPGYVWDRLTERGDKKMINDKIRFPLIQKALRLMLTGNYCPAQIHKKLNEWGYRTLVRKRIGGNKMSRSQIYRILKDKFYAGWYEYPKNSGNWYEGNHNKMITLQEYERIQILLGRRGSPRPKTHNFSYTGLISCGECGASITAEEKRQMICSNCKTKFAITDYRDSCPNCDLKIELMKNPKILHYEYYRCTKRKNPNCSQKCITKEKLEAQFDDLLFRIQISKEFKNWAIKHLNEVYKDETKDRNAILTSQGKAYDEVVKRIDNLVNLKISSQNSDGSLLTDEEFKKQKEILVIEKELLEEKRRDVESRVEKWLELSEKTFEFACYAKYWFSEGDSETKKEILRGIGSNITLKDKIVLVDVEKPLNFIEDAKNEVPEISEMFELKKKFINTSKFEDFYSQNLTLLPG